MPIQFLDEEEAAPPPVKTGKVVFLDEQTESMDFVQEEIEKLEKEGLKVF